MRHVWFDSNKICAVMPALILYNDIFEPMWKMKSSEVRQAGDTTFVCMNYDRTGLAIIRSGKGWGRRGRDKYYLVNFKDKSVVKLVKRPTKKIGGGWITCVDLPSGDRICFDWRNSHLGVSSGELVL